MSDPWWKSMRGRVRRSIAHWLRTEPFEVSDFRPRIRFGPESAVTSSPAAWLSASQARTQHPSDSPRGECARPGPAQLQGGSSASRLR